MNSTTIGPALRSDLPRIPEIQKEAYLSEAAIYDDDSIPPLRQTLAEMEREFEAKTFLKAETEGTVVGSVRVSLAGRTCLVERLIVDPRYQQRGIGSALLSHAESVFPEAASVELFTGTKSARNLALYQRRGYVRVREFELSPRVTVVTLRKQTAPARGAPEPHSAKA
jgi:N-acetylglutamate synthase-like GNAT family acetyltransferase